MRSRRLALALAWLQLFTSLVLTIAIVWGYILYRQDVARLVHSLTSSISAVAVVVTRTAETVEARKEMLVETQKMLVATRGLIGELKTAADTQSKTLPQYVAGIQATASFLNRAAGPLLSVGDQMTSVAFPFVEFNGPIPSLTMRRPLQDSGKEMMAAARDVRGAGEALAALAQAAGQDGGHVGGAVSATLDQSLRLIAEIEVTLKRVSAQDLPLAIAELKASARELGEVGTQMEGLGNAGLVLLGIALLASLWFVLSSLNALVSARSGWPARAERGREDGGHTTRRVAG